MSDPNGHTVSESALGMRPPTPFKELDFYDEDDAWKFAGRDREARQLVARIISSRAIVVHGRSGLGKTSLLRAGVVPLLRQQSLRPVYVRTLDSLLGDLADAVILDCGLTLPPVKGPDEQNDEDRARLALELAAKSGPIVLILDQFEEFFTRFEHALLERRAFVNFITEIVRNEKIDIRVVFSLREDYLCALDEFQRKLPDLFTEAYRLLPLTPLGAHEAIVRPLVNKGVRYDETLITRLVDELTGFDFDSARLQVTCSEVYRQALEGSNGQLALQTKDLEALEDCGSGLKGIYRRYLRKAIANIHPKLHLDAKLLLDRLITAKATKFAIARETLHEEFGTSASVDLALTALQEQKLIRREPRGGKEWFELRHECLVPEILDWFKDDDVFASFRFVRGLIEENSSSDRFRTHPEMLLTAGQLAAITPLREYARLTPQQLEYVIRSAAFAHSPEIRILARSAPRDFTEAIIRELIHSPISQMQVGAVKAIGLLESRAADLTDFCLQLASDKNTSAELLTAAQDSAAQVITGVQIPALRSRVRFGRTPPHVRDLLVTLYEAGHMRSGFSATRRWLTWGDAVRRRLRKYAEHRTTFIVRGVIGGTCGSVLFALSSMVVYAVFGNLVPLLSAENISAALGILGGALIVGVIIGYRNGAAAFRTCALGTTRWRTAAMPLLVGPASGWRAFLALFSLLIFMAYTLAWLIIRLVNGCLVGMVESYIRKHPTAKERIILSLLISFLPALTAADVVSYLTKASPSDMGDAFLGVAACLMYSLCIDLCSFSVAMPDGGIPGARPIGEENVINSLTTPKPNYVEVQAR